MQNGQIHVYCINVYEKNLSEWKGLLLQAEFEETKSVFLFVFFNNFVCSLYYWKIFFSSDY